MSWLSKSIDKLSGKSMKEDLGALGGRWDDAYGESLDVQDELLQGGRDMLDPYSQKNLMMKSMMGEQSSDNMAEAMRLQGRNAKMQGGAPIGVMAQQGLASAQKNEASNLGAFNQYLQGQQSQGYGLMSGAASNMANLRGNRFNLLENQNQANKQIDADATKWGVNMLSQGAQMAMAPNPQSMMGLMGMAEGGWVPESYDANDSSQKLNINAQNSYLKMIQGINAPVMDDYDTPDFPEDSEPEPKPGGMLRTVMGPKGPIKIGTRMGGEYIG